MNNTQEEIKTTESQIDDMAIEYAEYIKGLVRLFVLEQALEPQRKKYLYERIIDEIVPNN